MGLARPCHARMSRPRNGVEKALARQRLCSTALHSHACGTCREQGLQMSPANRLPALSLLQGRAAVRTEQRGEAAAQGYRPLPYPTARAPDGRVHAVRVPAEGRERARVLQVPQLDAVVPAAAQEHAPPHRVPAQRVDLHAPGGARARAWAGASRGRARGRSRRCALKRLPGPALRSQEDTEHTERAICGVNQNTRGRILGSVPFAGLALV